MKNLHEVLELTNAAAKLLSQGDANLPNNARNLAGALTDKALALLTGENAGTVKDIRDGNVTIGAVEVGYCDDGSVWLLADGEGGSFPKDEFEACLRQFIKERI